MGDRWIGTSFWQKGFLTRAQKRNFRRSKARARQQQQNDCNYNNDGINKISQVKKVDLGEKGGGNEVGGVGKDVDLNFEKEKRMREQTLKEIVETESKYVEDLFTVIMYFSRPLSSNVSRFPELSNRVTVLLSTLEFIFEGNSALLEKLKSESSSDVPIPMIGKVFLNHEDNFTYYAVLCNHQTEALEALDYCLRTSPKFKTFVEESCSRGNIVGLGISDYLVKPFQRLLKYPLLLNELLKHTTSDHPDRNNIVEALEKIQTVVNGINAGKSQSDTMKRMVESTQKIEGVPRGFKLLTPGRSLIKEGTVMKISGKNDQEREFFLFSDCLLYAKKKRRGEKFSCKGIIYLNNLHVDLVDDLKWKIFRSDKNLTYYIHGDNPRETEDWLRSIRDLQEKRQRSRPQPSAFKLTLKKAPQQVKGGDKTMSFLRVYFPSSKSFKTFPVTPETTAREVCSECQRKAAMENPGVDCNYDLFIVINNAAPRKLSDEEEALSVAQAAKKKDKRFGTSEESSFRVLGRSLAPSLPEKPETFPSQMPFEESVTDSEDDNEIPPVPSLSFFRESQVENQKSKNLPVLPRPAAQTLIPRSTILRPPPPRPTAQTLITKPSILLPTPPTAQTGLIRPRPPQPSPPRPHTLPEPPTPPHTPPRPSHQPVGQPKVVPRLPPRSARPPRPPHSRPPHSRPPHAQPLRAPPPPPPQH